VNRTAHAGAVMPTQRPTQSERKEVINELVDELIASKP
jgi:hypothetical protein